MKDGAENIILNRSPGPTRGKVGHHLLSADEETTLALRWLQEQDSRARDKILLAYRPLCLSIARRMAPRHLFGEDIVQEGMLGLMHALDRFDPALGFRFGTYARWWVRAQISSALVTTESQRAGLTGETMKLRRGYDLARRTVMSDLRKKGESVTPHELRTQIADRMGVAPHAIEQFEAARSYQSLNTPVGEDEGRTLEMIDVLPAAELSGEARLDHDRRDSVQEQAITELFQGLSAREVDVIERRFGRNREAETLREIAQDLGLTAERVRQIEVKALTKMRDLGRKRLDLRVVTETLVSEDAA